MPDTAPATNHKIKALELAIQHGGEKPADVVTRATAYHGFLAGAAPAAGATAGAAGAKPGAGAKPDATKAGAGAKPDATKTAADKAAADKAAKAGAKPDATATKAGATAGKAGAPTGAAVAPDTKAPGGKHTYADVVDALRKVKDKSSKEDAIAILVEDGGGAKSVRDLKPALYDAVVEAANNVLNGDGEGEATGGDGETDLDDPTAQPARDELGL